MHHAGLNQLLNSEEGTLGRYIDRKAEAVYYKAYANASGRPGPNVRLDILRGSLRSTGVGRDEEGLVAFIGTDARSPRQDYPYPVALETGYDPVTGQPLSYHYPFLMPALEEEFRS